MKHKSHFGQIMPSSMISNTNKFTDSGNQVKLLGIKECERKQQKCNNWIRKWYSHKTRRIINKKAVYTNTSARREEERLIGGAEKGWISSTSFCFTLHIKGHPGDTTNTSAKELAGRVQLPNSQPTCFHTIMAQNCTRAAEHDPSGLKQKK